MCAPAFPLNCGDGLDGSAAACGSRRRGAEQIGDAWIGSYLFDRLQSAAGEFDIQLDPLARLLGGVSQLVDFDWSEWFVPVLGPSGAEKCHGYQDTGSGFRESVHLCLVNILFKRSALKLSIWSAADCTGA